MTDDLSRMQQLLEALPQDILELDSHYRVVFRSRPQPDASDDYLSTLAPQDAEQARRTLALVLDDGIARTFSSRSGGRDYSTWVCRVGDPASLRLGLTIQDMTDARVAERALTAERKRLEVALQASGVGLWSWHLPTGKVLWDERMRELTGLAEPLALPEWIETLSHPEDRAALRERAKGVAKPGRFPSDVSRIVRPDGQIRWVMTAGTVIPDSDGNPEWMVGGLMDVTEQQRVADELQDAHRMESLAQLTGGVAHNFNNMLMIIAPCLEFIRETATGAILEDVEDALKATQRASDIVAQLMTFSGRQNNREKSVCSAAEVCEETIRLCCRSFPASIQVSREVTTKARIEVTPGAVEQILGNVLFNARDALSSANVQSARVEIVARDVSYFGEDWVEITVSDNGPGVPEEIRNKLFEPFVTSKRGTGTGLGLASSMALVQQHLGQLAYRPSQLGGAEFLILLPQHGAPTEEAEEVPGSSRRVLSQVVDGTPRILLVDDEPAIRRVLSNGLPRFGFDIVATEGRRDLVELLNEDTAFSIVLLDRSLGEEDGVKLLPLLRNRVPAAKVFFFTGEFIDDEESKLVEGVVQKPVNVRSLAGVLKEAI